jgi:hypothetical protein
VILGVYDDINQLRLAAQGCLPSVDFAFTTTSAL